ncbi:MAG: hypothetical protein WB473_01670 [Pedococcus sp.]
MVVRRLSGVESARVEPAAYRDADGSCASDPPVGRLLLALVLGLFPLMVPFAVWATVSYWRAPRRRWVWRAVALVLVALGLANFVG